MIITKHGLSGFFSDFRLRNRTTGNETPILGVRPNLITDAGLDMPGAHSWSAIFAYAMIGTGSTAATYADTALEAQTHYTNTYSATANGQLCSAASKYIEHYRWFVLENATESAITFREMAVGPTSTTIFNRIVLDANVSIPAGYDLIWKYTLRVTYPEWRNPTTCSVTAGGGTTGAKFAIYERGTGTTPDYIMEGVIGIAAYGAAYENSSYLDYLLEPCSPSTYTDSRSGVGLRAITSAISELTSATSVTSTQGSTPYYLPVLAAYTAGNHYRDHIFTIPTGDYPETALYGFAWNQGYNSYGGAFRLCEILRFDSAITKPATATWTITHRTEWARA